MKIQVLYFAGCPNYQAAIDRVSEVAPQAVVEAVEVTSQEEAVRMRFLGSPTILVDGVDVEPDARERRDFGFTCRTYSGGGVPSRELLAAAIPASRASRAPTIGGRLAASSMLVATIATACCWLPLALAAFGLSAAGFSPSFEASRWWLLAAAATLVGVGFASVHRNRSCYAREPDAGPWRRSALRRLGELGLHAAVVCRTAQRVDRRRPCCPSSPSGCCRERQAVAPSVRPVSFAASEQDKSVTALSEDVHELKDAFNAAKGTARVMLIVSPRCPVCRRGATVVQQQALAHVDSDKTKVLVVWIKRFPGDSLQAAQEATTLVSDPRATHFWDASGALGKLYGKTLKLPGGRKFAWDVYFVFGPKAEWTSSPPAPDFWMHQLGGTDTGKLLDGEKFREAIAAQLP